MESEAYVISLALLAISWSVHDEDLLLNFDRFLENLKDFQ
jgi:hypothetical protein